MKTFCRKSGCRELVAEEEELCSSCKAAEEEFHREAEKDRQAEDERIASAMIDEAEERDRESRYEPVWVDPDPEETAGWEDRL